LLLLSFLKRCLIAAGFWPLMLLPIFAAVAARRPKAVMGSVAMAALALFANPRGPNNTCLDNDVVETRQRVEQQVERRMNPDRNANVVAIATRGREGGERMSLDQALADPERFFANCGRPIYLSSELLFNVNEAAISERAPRRQALTVHGREPLDARPLQQDRRPARRCLHVAHGVAAGAAQITLISTRRFR
jgi:hypothetical protein